VHQVALLNQQRLGLLVKEARGQRAADLDLQVRQERVEDFGLAPVNDLVVVAHVVDTHRDGECVLFVLNTLRPSIIKT
jgi:hypothetical protein|tara:strand:+ start:275 stop:508 length:234 start_codon:yes stop_codon:yes gene_type:complete